MIGFELLARDGAARRGRLMTAHGAIDTPVFMPVGTAGAIKAMTPEGVAATGARIVLGNTYHLMLRPGAERIAALGGLHRFMNWPYTILTDSGGFQVMSLAARRTIGEAGVTFRSHLDGSLHELTPERIFDRTWALTLPGRVVERLRRESDEAGRSERVCCSLPAGRSELGCRSEPGWRPEPGCMTGGRATLWSSTCWTPPRLADLRRRRERHLRRPSRNRRNRHNPWHRRHLPQRRSPRCRLSRKLHPPCSRSRPNRPPPRHRHRHPSRRLRPRPLMGSWFRGTRNSASRPSVVATPP